MDPVVSRSHRERACLLRAAPFLPVPEVLGHDDGPPARLELRWIEGRPVTAVDHGALESLGVGLARLHAEDAGVGPAAVVSHLRELVEDERDWADDELGASVVDGVAALVEAAVPCLLARRPSLVHGDLQPDHVLVDDRGHLAGVLDWADGRAGHPAEDLAVLSLFDEALLEPVLAGYGALAFAPGELELTIPAFAAVRHLGSIRWLRTHGFDPSAHVAALVP